MAHKLEIRNGNASFFTAKEKAWHGLGQLVPEAVTAEEAIKLANLDYTVGITKIYADIGTKEKPQAKEIQGSFATYRTDTKDVFGIVGSRYTVVQNSEAFSFFDPFIDKKDAVFETAGVLGKGEAVFITAKLPKNIVVANNDVIEQYILLTMSHDGSASIQAMFTPIRVVCNNTLQFALKSAKKKISIKHTASSRDKLKEASKLLGIISNNQAKLGEAYNHLYKTPCTDQQFGRLLGALYYTDEEIYQMEKNKVKAREVLSTNKYNKMMNALDYYQTGVGQQDIKGTMWGAYNAITGYYQNVFNYSDDDSKFESIMFGKANADMEKAFQLCMNPIEIESNISYSVNNYQLQKA
jgi:phage/plasmid-like protein (TIGR03299 family)